MYFKIIYQMVCTEIPHSFTVLKFELIIRLFVRSLKEADIKLNKLSVKAIALWFFALSHRNYSSTLASSAHS